jgi:hypothetical protein
MLRKFAAVLIAASMLTAPAFAQGTATPAAKAPATAPAPAAKAVTTAPAAAAPAASTITTKVIKKNKKAKHVKHVRHVKHAKKVRHHHVSKTVIAKPMTAPAAPSRTN